MVAVLDLVTSQFCQGWHLITDLDLIIHIYMFEVNNQICEITDWQKQITPNGCSSSQRVFSEDGLTFCTSHAKPMNHHVYCQAIYGRESNFMSTYFGQWYTGGNTWSWSSMSSSMWGFSPLITSLHVIDVRVAYRGDLSYRYIDHLSVDIST